MFAGYHPVPPIPKKEDSFQWLKFNCGRQEEPANPNLRVVTAHASHVCRYGMHKVQLDHAPLDLTRNLVTRVLNICHVKLTQSTAMEQER